MNETDVLAALDALRSAIMAPSETAGMKNSSLPNVPGYIRTSDLQVVFETLEDLFRTSYSVYSGIEGAIEMLGDLTY